MSARQVVHDSIEERVRKVFRLVVIAGVIALAYLGTAWGIRALSHHRQHTYTTLPVATRAQVAELGFAVLSPSIIVPTGLVEPEKHLITDRGLTWAVMRPGEEWEWRIPPRMYPLYVDVCGLGARVIKIDADGKIHNLNKQAGITRLGTDGDVKVATDRKGSIDIGLYKFFSVDHKGEIRLRLTVDPSLKDPVFYWRPTKAMVEQTKEVDGDQGESGS